MKYFAEIRTGINRNNLYCPDNRYRGLKTASPVKRKQA